MEPKKTQPLSDEYLRAQTIGELRPLSAAIAVVPYDPAWPDRFQQEARQIAGALGEQPFWIEHVGSTSVPTLSAKPIIDILLVVSDSANETAYAPALARVGFTLRIREPDWYEHRMLRGQKDDVNLHVFSEHCPEVNRMLAFRDWLRVNEADRERYAECKCALAQRQWKYTQNYADAKTSMIQEILSRALGHRADVDE